MDLTGDLLDFAEAVGRDGAVAPVGGGTQWDATGAPGRVVRSPGGIVTYEPAEMTVRVRAGTTIAELAATLAEHGQMVPVDPAAPDRATVGGVLAEGASGLRRLRYGPVRDTLLEVRYISAEGRLIKAGGPVVKNVSGFDLCRLMVGSKGTLGVFAEVVLRARPIPQVSRWLMGRGDPRNVSDALHAPSSILWDGHTTWVLLEGHAADVTAQASVLGRSFVDVGGPPRLPPFRRSIRPSAIRSLTGEFVAEVGVGTVHVPTAPVATEPDRVDLHKRIKTLFDPTNRLNPGRLVA